MLDPAESQRRSLYRAALVASITCTLLLAITSALSVLAWFEVAAGAYALAFLSLLGGGYLLPLGGVAFGGIAVFLAQQWNDRRIAVLAVVVSIGISGTLYSFGAHFVRE